MSTNFETKPDAWGIEHLGVKYLSDRGITSEIAAAMGIKFITHGEAHLLLHRPEDEKKPFFPGRSALWIPTIGIDGSPHPYHGQAIFFNPNKDPFKRHTETTDDFPNEVSYLLSKPLVEGDTVYWCESALKAATLRYHYGLNAIGMNGVFGFFANKRLVKSAKALPGNLVHVLIVDSLNDKNKKSLSQVLNARRRWRLALKQLDSPTLRYIELPKPPADFQKNGRPKTDWGVDDFRMVRGHEALGEVLRTTTEFHDVGEMKVWLDDFNSRFVYVKANSKVFDRSLNQFLTRTNFYDNNATARVGDDPVAPAWFCSPDRSEVDGLAFAPNQPEIAHGKLNIWRGFALEPHSNDLAVQKFWVDTILEAFGPDGRYFIEFAAALIQFPAKRLSRYVFLGGKQGTGKNFVVEPLVRIFGAGVHCQTWTVANFINNFNSLHRACRLGILNEPGDPHNLENKVRVAIGEVIKKNGDQNETQLQLEGKGTDIVVVDRLQSNIIISNYGPPHALESSDRRGIMLRANQRMSVKAPNNLGEKDLDYWGERWHWLNYEDGAAEVFDYLKRYDLSKVDLDGPAPMTAYKAELLRSSPDTVQTFMEQFNADPRTMFRSVLGEDFELPKPCIIDADIAGTLFGLLVRSVDNQAAFTTSVGKLALSVWECASVQVTAKNPLRGADRKGPATIGARVYMIVDNRIVAYDKSLSGADCLRALEDLRLRIKGDGL